MSRFFKTIIFIVLAILAVILTLILVFLLSAQSWSDEFYSSINPEYMISQSSQLDKSVEEKIQEYILSDEEIYSVTFNSKEVGKLVYDSLQNMTGEGVIVKKVYIAPSKRIWNICALTQYEELSWAEAWVCADVTKDDMETAQLYITTLKVEGIEVSKIYPEILTKVNKGIAEALVTANENGFVGRVFENIELQENQLVVKGSLY